MVVGAWFIALAVFADFVRVLPVSP